MPSDLAAFIAETPLVDTHEHQFKESQFLEWNWDILTSLFNGYLPADFVVAGASWPEARRLGDSEAGSIAERFGPVAHAWEAIKHTGYGEGALAAARILYGIDEITLETLEQADEKARALQRPGERLRLLRDVANLDHVQIDDWVFEVEPDPAGPEFFLYDLSMNWPISMQLSVENILSATGVEVRDLATMEEAVAALFTAYGPVAIAVKSQHAYQRTLAWEERDRVDAARAFDAVLAGGAGEADRLCAGDWIWARVVEHCIEHELPLKLHTGYYAGAGNEMQVERIRTGQLSPLLARYPEARFVLMHIAYPYDRELVAVAKHFPNVWVDLCWAWAVDPHSSCDLVRRFLHAAPASKLFAFGGDDRWPTSAVGDAWQARKWLTRALEAEIAEGDMTEREAIDVARRLMRENQYACFDIPGTRRAIAARAEPATTQGGREQ